MSTIAVVGLKRWNEWTLRIVGCTLAKQFLGNTISCDPNMILTSKVGLIDATVLLSPLVKFEEAVFIWHVWYTAEDRITWRISANEPKASHRHLALTFGAWQSLYSCRQLVLLRTVDIIYERHHSNYNDHSDERYKCHNGWIQLGGLSRAEGTRMIRYYRTMIVRSSVK